MAPHTTASAYLRWTVPLGTGVGSIVAQADVYHQARIQFNDINDPLSHQDAYTLGNVRVAWEDMLGHPMDLSALVRNVADKEYYATGVTVYPSLGYSVGAPGAPRTYAVELSYRF
jgi:iron complex outermembrane receptor protein